jgi:hypothetical protein
MKNLTKTTIALLIAITAIILFPPSVISQQLILEEKIAKEIIKYSSASS